jgi:hypothetical protein
LRPSNLPSPCGGSTCLVGLGHRRPSRQIRLTVAGLRRSCASTLVA